MLLHRDRPVMLTISTRSVVHTSRKLIALVGMVNGRGYNGQQTDAICYVRWPCQMIWSTLKLVFRWFWLIGHAYELLRCLDVEIWQFSWWQQQTDKFIPMHTRGIVIVREREREREREKRQKLTRALRAHTPRAPCICVIVQLLLLTTFTYTY